MTGTTSAQRLQQGLRSGRFWAVQVSVVLLSGLHDVLLERLGTGPVAHGVPATLTSSLLLVPVIYAALTFGVHAAVLTTVWATVLVVPHWVVYGYRPMEGAHLWIEVTTFVVVTSVGVVVGQRVDRELQARSRAEEAEARYRALFDEHAAPVLVTSTTGTVLELNAAAQELLGPSAVEHPLEDSLGVPLDVLRQGGPPYLTVGAGVGERHFAVSTTEVVGEPLLQVVLTDCTEQHRREHERRAFSTRLIRAVEEERGRLARELHDEPLQDLVYLARALGDLARDPDLPPRLVDELERTRALSRRAAGDLRTLIRGVRPPVLDDLGLVPAVRQLVEQAGQRAPVDVRLTVSGEPVRLPAEVELTAYRVVQESLSNVLRHARAGTAEVQLSLGTELVVQVRDDGQGFDPAWDQPRTQHGLGLLGVAERVASVDGTTAVSSAPGAGTTVRVTIPLAAW